MDISRLHRNTSLLALNMSIDSGLREARGLTHLNSKIVRKRTTRDHGLSTKAVLGTIAASAEQTHHSRIATPHVR
jgi:hypothetical protein